MITQELLTSVGRLFKPHGYKGELKVNIEFDSDMNAILNKPFFVKIDNLLVPFFAEKFRGGKSGNSFVKFRNVDSDLEALALSNKDLFMLKSDVADLLGIESSGLEDLEQGYVGFNVFDSHNNVFIGSVENMEEGVEYDYLSVRKEKDGNIIDIPFIEEFVEEIEYPEGGKKGKIIVNLPDGMLEI